MDVEVINWAEWQPSLPKTGRLSYDTFNTNFNPILDIKLYLITISFFSFPLLPALSNLSVLFHLPEGEWFRITGLINKVNTDRRSLTQRCADRAGKQRSS